MAEEGNLGVARALESGRDSTKEDLQSRVEEARETITETVTELRDAAINKFHTVKESVTEAVDWREQVRKRPVAWSLGALGVGILVGYRVAGLIESEDEPGDDAEDVPAPVQYEAGGPSAFSDHHSYAAHARAVARVDDDHVLSEQGRPGLIDRFKETRAYDRLQEEVSELGSRFVAGLADAARSIIFPALFNKVKQVIDNDVSNNRPSNNTSVRQPEATGTRPADTVVPIVSSESGKAAYPMAETPIGKVDRLESNKSSTVEQSDNSPHINLNYDDRYERESKLFSRGEDRGFSARATSEIKPAIPEKRSTDRDDVPRGGDYGYQPGRDSKSLED